MTLAPSHDSNTAPWAYPLYRLTLAVAAATRLEDIFDAALTALEDILDVHRASVLLFDEQGRMRFRAWRALSDAYREAVDGHSPWSPDTRDAQPVLVEDVTTDPELTSLRDVFDAERIRALAFIPLKIGTKLLGKFMLYYAEPHCFDERDVMAAEIIAAHVAFAIDQQAHRDSERRYRDLLESLGVAVYTTDAHGRITFFNEEAVSLWGRRPQLGEERWCGSHRLFWSDGAPMPHEDCPMAMAIRGRSAVRGYDAIAERPDGSRANFIPYPTPIFNETGQLTGAVNVLVDVTGLKRAETSLEEKEAALLSALADKERLLRARNDTIRQHERTQSQLASMIEASEALIGGTRSDMGAATILEVGRQLLAADAYGIWRFFEQPNAWTLMLTSGLSEQFTSQPLPRPDRPADGSPRTTGPIIVEDPATEPRLAGRRAQYEQEGIRSLFILPLNVEGDMRGTLVFYYRTPHTFSDLEERIGRALSSLASASLGAAHLFEENERARTALTEANRELQQTAAELKLANAAKDEFLGLVSHELKTPLTTVRGNAEVLGRAIEKLAPDLRDQALHDIVVESERLQRIIENLLLLARAEQAGADLDREPVIVRRVARAVVERHRRTRRDRTFELVVDSVAVPVLCSTACIEQIVDNFLTNAEKYSPAGERIIVNVECDAAEVRVRVLDGGNGIDPAEVERLFTPFYRSELSSGQAAGLGIGLAVCKRLAEAHGGRIWARAREGGGAEFGFALPAIAADD